MTTPLILATGASGQLGQTLSRLWAATPLPGYRFVALDRAALDIGEADMTNAVLSRNSPAIIINAAAYTQVDRAESERAAAYRINDEAVATLAGWTAANGARLLHISTDFVFDGSADTPYDEEHPTRALGVYGASKLAGEERVLELAGDRGTILRTSWLYSEHGGNFVRTMLRLMAEREELSVVNDQIGSPTSTQGLAQLLFAMIARGGYEGVYHWTDGGSISWFDFAVEIQRQALTIGLLDSAIPIHPIATSEYPTPARRPSYSVLDRRRALTQFDCPAQDWKAQLERVLKALADAPRGTE